MNIQFEKTLCPRHHLQVDYYCEKDNCNCQTRLCLKCLQEHQNAPFTHQQTLKNRVATSINLVNKTYQHLINSKPTLAGNSFLDSQNQESVEIVKRIMIKVSSQNKKLREHLQNFIYNHAQVKKKLDYLKNSHSGAYMTTISSQGLTNLVINTLSQSGLERFRQRLKQCHLTIDKYQQFKNSVLMYGNTSQQFLQGIGFQELSLKKRLIKLLDTRLCKQNCPSFAEQPQRERYYSGKERKENSREGKKGIELITRSPAKQKKVSLTRKRIFSGKEENS